MLKPSRQPVGLDQLVDTRDVMSALRISRRTLQRLLESGKFPRPDRRVGRGLRWKRETIQVWINNTD